MALPKNTAKFRSIAPRIIARLMEDFGLTEAQVDQLLIRANALVS